jgi:hypothetical protein
MEYILRCVLTDDIGELSDLSSIHCIICEVISTVSVHITYVVFHNLTPNE